MTLKLVDRFTTQDGNWEWNGSKPYGIQTGAIGVYGNEPIPGKGGANHIFVKAPAGVPIEFNTTDGQNHALRYVDASGWVNFPMFHSSSYVPGRGEQGPWNVFANGRLIAGGIGLPDGLHVSTFLVVADVPDVVSPEPLPDDHVQVLVNGEVVFDNWSNS